MAACGHHLATGEVEIATDFPPSASVTGAVAVHNAHHIIESIRDEPTRLYRFDDIASGEPFSVAGDILRIEVCR